MAKAPERSAMVIKARAKAFLLQTGCEPSALKGPDKDIAKDNLAVTCFSLCSLASILGASTRNLSLAYAGPLKASAR